MATRQSAVASAAAGARLAAIDATRGAAMLFVCLAHFGSGYFLPLGDLARVRIIDQFGMVASPTFMLVSGAMVGLLAYRQSGAEFASTRAMLAGRGLFLLTIGRLVISACHAPLTPSFAELRRWGFVTDAIGIAILVGPSIVVRLTPARRAWVALGIYVLSWLAVFAWNPHAVGWRVVKDALVGPRPDAPSTLLYNFPLVPWFAVYLAGSALGAALGTRAERGGAAALTRACVKLAAATVVLAAIVLALGHLLAHEVLTGAAAHNAYHLSSAFQKLPPGPGYLLAYGGIGLALAAATFAATTHGVASSLIVWLQRLGQTSLFVFLLQYAVFYTGFVLLALPYTPWWPLYFLASVWGISLVAGVWQQRGLNRYLTVPISWGRATAQPLANPRTGDSIPGMSRSSPSASSP